MKKINIKRVDIDVQFVNIIGFVEFLLIALRESIHIRKVSIEWMGKRLDSGYVIAINRYHIKKVKEIDGEE